MPTMLRAVAFAVCLTALVATSEGRAPSMCQAPATDMVHNNIGGLNTFVCPHNPSCNMWRFGDADIQASLVLYGELAQPVSVLTPAQVSTMADQCSGFGPDGQCYLNLTIHAVTNAASIPTNASWNVFAGRNGTAPSNPGFSYGGPLSRVMTLSPAGRTDAEGQPLYNAELRIQVKLCTDFFAPWSQGGFISGVNLFWNVSNAAPAACWYIASNDFTQVLEAQKPSASTGMRSACSYNGDGTWTKYASSQQAPPVRVVPMPAQQPIGADTACRNGENSASVRLYRAPDQKVTVCERYSGTFDRVDFVQMSAWDTQPESEQQGTLRLVLSGPTKWTPAEVAGANYEVRLLTLRKTHHNNVQPTSHFLYGAPLNSTNLQFARCIDGPFAGRYGWTLLTPQLNITFSTTSTYAISVLVNDRHNNTAAHVHVVQENYYNLLVQDSSNADETYDDCVLDATSFTFKPRRSPSVVTGSDSTVNCMRQ